MSFPPDVKEQAFVASARCCCLCHRFRGIKIEAHHIVQKAEGGQDTFENCIPLCFDCHADMRSYDHKHPKGSKYTPSELIKHREEWYYRVKNSPVNIYTGSNLEADKQNYQRLIGLLPWDGSVKFARENNFDGWSYESNRVDQFINFLYQCGDPGFTFIDLELESLKGNLAIAIQNFTKVEASETFLTNNPGRRAVPEEWEFTQPQRFKKAVADLHDLGTQIGVAYDQLIQTGRRKLGV